MYILQSIREGRTQWLIGPWNGILRRRKHRVSNLYGFLTNQAFHLSFSKVISNRLIVIVLILLQ